MAIQLSRYTSYKYDVIDLRRSIATKTPITEEYKNKLVLKEVQRHQESDDAALTLRNEAKLRNGEGADRSNMQ